VSREGSRSIYIREVSRSIYIRDVSREGRKRDKEINRDVDTLYHKRLKTSLLM